MVQTGFVREVARLVVPVLVLLLFPASPPRSEAQAAAPVAESEGGAAATPEEAGERPADPLPDPGRSAADRRKDFMQENFDWFVPVEFAKGEKGYAAVQLLKVRENSRSFEGVDLVGFRFFVPEWADGPLHFLHLIAKTEAQKDFFTKNKMPWGIVPRQGKFDGQMGYSPGKVEWFPDLKARFPHTMKLYTVRVGPSGLRPGEEYAIWFGYQETDMPDIAFSITIESLRGQEVVGWLPLK